MKSKKGNPARIDVRLLRAHETSLYRAVVDLLAAEKMTSIRDPFGFGGGAEEAERSLRQVGAIRPERMRPRIHIAERGGRVIGVAAVYPNFSWVDFIVKHKNEGKLESLELALSRANISKMVVAPIERGRGVGGRLVQAAVAQARKDGFAMVTGFAEGDLPALRRFYVRHGMTMSDTGNRNTSTIFGSDVATFSNTLRQGEYFWMDLEQPNASAGVSDCRIDDQTSSQRDH